MIQYAIPLALLAAAVPLAPHALSGRAEAPTRFSFSCAVTLDCLRLPTEPAADPLALLPSALHTVAGAAPAAQPGDAPFVTTVAALELTGRYDAATWDRAGTAPIGDGTGAVLLAGALAVDVAGPGLPGPSAMGGGWGSSRTGGHAAAPGFANAGPGNAPGAGVRTADSGERGDSTPAPATLLAQADAPPPAAAPAEALASPAALAEPASPAQATATLPAATTALPDAAPAADAPAGLLPLSPITPHTGPTAPATPVTPATPMAPVVPAALPWSVEPADTLPPAPAVEPLAPLPNPLLEQAPVDIQEILVTSLDDLPAPPPGGTPATIGPVAQATDDPNGVPEPAGLALFGLAGTGAFLAGRRRLR